MEADQGIRRRRMQGSVIARNFFLRLVYSFYDRLGKTLYVPVTTYEMLIELINNERPANDKAYP